MNLELSDEKTAALLRGLDNFIDGDRFPLSPRIRMLKGEWAILTLARASITFLP